MSKSVRLRAEDWRSLHRLVGECRELGDDGDIWREHVMTQVSRWIDVEFGMIGEMASCRALNPQNIGVVTWGWQTGFVDRNVVDVMLEAFQHDPDFCPTMVEGFRLWTGEAAACFSRSDIVADRPWYASLEYQLIQKRYGTDHTLFCFQSIVGPVLDESMGLVLSRAEGRRDFSGRERAIALETTTTLTPLIGGPLARFSEPSPTELPPRVRQVLRYLLEGDGDKQIASRLQISEHTVNQYTKAIFRHFGVRGRVELLARWIRRGWCVQSSRERLKGTF